jgi:L-lactate dehydrogenase complex protein LldF
MPNEFKTRIRSALADENLQTALDNNYERRKNGRLLAYTSLPEDLQVMRQRAHAVRAEVIAHLDRYLDEFVHNASAHGVTIHHAADGAQAVQIVLEIAHKNNARLVAKAKSMVSEEIHLNHALEEAGIRAIETDLGEYIVQLRGELPAHIITPAVHLRRADVGKLFNEKLGLPYTEDVTVMTSAARKELRQVFLEADIGISGVNFGVAETGTYCLVTNEGNGRMVATLPPVHIALMGIERLVPTLDDLALMLYLLPRSATGQKLSSYVSLMHGPSVSEEGAGLRDGPRERHLILLDNGRRSISKSSLAEALYCIRCGTCLNMCPVFREIGGHAYVSIHGQGSIYPGPIGSVLAPALFGQGEYGQLARASSLCGACKESCPVDIDLPKLLLRVRAGVTLDVNAEGRLQNHTRMAKPNTPAYLNLGLRIFTWIATSPGRFAAAQRMAGFFSALVTPREPWLKLPAITGWGYSKDMPAPAKRPFRDLWSERKPAPASPSPVKLEHNIISDADNAAENDLHQAQISAGDMIDRFSSELQALGGHVVVCPSGELAAGIADLLRQMNIDRVQSWDASHLPAGLLDQLQAAGIKIDFQTDPQLVAGLTGADAAIAESGTLLLTGEPTRPLTASLVPEIHIAVLPASRIYATLPEVLGLPELRASTAGVFITGPSRTADIEMTLTVGMHGPREVHVFCLLDR